MAKTIQDYQTEYKNSYANKDYAGMRAANTAANSLRAASGQAAYDSSVGDAQRAGYTNVASTAGLAKGTTAEDYYSSKLAQQQAALQEAQQRQQQMLQNQANTAISGVNTQSNKALQDAYIASQKAKMAAPQSLAALGYTGGAAESSLLGLDTTYQNNRNALETARANSINSINSDLSNNTLSLGSDYYNQLAQAQANAAAQAQEQTNWQKTYDANQLAQNKSDYANTLGAYYNDYQAQINALSNDGDTSNDWQIPYLQAARTQKQSDQQTQAATAKQQNFQNASSQTDSYNSIAQEYQAGLITRSQANYMLQLIGLPASF